jgi:hypothetical protein
MDITKIKNDKKIFEKVILAYWYSIPCDGGTFPDNVEIVRDNTTFFNVNLIKNNVVYGMASIGKNEIDRYLEKLRDLKEHEIDIIDRLEKEITTTKEKINKQKAKKR